jgi:hypothetical protein
MEEREGEKRGEEGRKKGRKKEGGKHTLSTIIWFDYP